ncbi:hypothetical protein HYV88_00560 [Candidatus Woesearchaeota archaeon]|nr:hypothetical protein [Candidatus Woesearchaeota archaeon]
MIYNYKSTLVYLFLIALALLIYYKLNLQGLIIYLIILIVLEILSELLINKLRERFQWLITKKKDFLPKLDKEGLNKFFPHGFDPELGWVRKPNTEHDEKGKFGKTTWHINSIGARSNPGCEGKKPIISCYGDSFAFSRQVNDNETWPHYLSKLTKTNVLNWGVGNHGIDQSLLRLKREYPKHKTKIVLLGVVPDTVSRIMSTWKHFYEYGNAFAFKPRFKLENNKLKLIKTPIDSENRYYNYEKYIDEIIKEDFFYKYKFRKELIQFPYLISILKNTKRNFPLIYYNALSLIYEKLNKDPEKYKALAMQKIMRINKWWRLKLYKEKEVVDLLVAIVKEFINYSKKQKFTPIFVLLPQKDDVNYIRKHNHFYQHLKDQLKNDLLLIDLAEELLRVKDLDNLYSDDSEYGGHYSKFGNEFIAKTIFKVLKENKLI